MSACFSPGRAICAEMIADAVDAAETSVRVKAYWLLSVPILRALAATRRRGVDVRAILDRPQNHRDSPHGRYSRAVYLVHARVPVWIDAAVSIAHNKVLVLDGATVITGSFNFTTSAGTRNAENVMVIRSPEVAAWYARNWEAGRAGSRVFAAE